MTLTTAAVQDLGIDFERASVDANGFICDLIDDAVDDFAEDLIHDVDDVYPSSPAVTVTPMKVIPGIPINDAQLVLSSSEPAIHEEVEEDEDICMSARLLTARAAEDAISVVAPGSPSWSLEVNAPSQISEITSLKIQPRQLD